MEQNASLEFAKKVEMPVEFPEILKDFSREVLRHQPENIYAFGITYFEQKCASAGGGLGSSALAEDMSLEQMEEIIQVLFHKYDEDKSGYLDRREFRKLLQDLRTQVPFISEDDLFFFMSEADGDENNRIEYDEFIPVALQIIQTMYSKKKHEQHKAEVTEEARNILVHGMDREELEGVLQSLFRNFDTDGSGSLSRQEFEKALSSMELGLTRKEVNSILFHYDADDDGNITYSEFVPFAFDLLAKLTEMRIFETEMAHDELAQFLVDLFKAKETELGAPAGPGMLPVEEIKDLLHQASLGLTRLQVISVVSAADVNDEGLVSYMQFIPKAVDVARAMMRFEDDLQAKVEWRDFVLVVQQTLEAMPCPSPFADVQAGVLALGLEDSLARSVLTAAKFATLAGGVDTATLAHDVPSILKNAGKGFS
mmetsp:Transcript_24303/g.61120  ORF Transcript_24303/g.61120 Transcript_24303/m.61120 type:complete len:425 (+) Transcript_24303:149-1423(+)|eukprot:CAMPEP_0179009432 /NCGR_PEP_ID=MMETSP0795-20121207/16271_1 /TAXON_ID=88552 /ORGANISM="Amoebophrya sp., Strain Ameob2" /LENGTH=424 /DNA_ID=CAMNT_0020704633 /DNA_START=75 /DNA_END=1349 /DNA_ORIENTATION=-